MKLDFLHREAVTCLPVSFRLIAQEGRLRNCKHHSLQEDAPSLHIQEPRICKLLMRIELSQLREDITQED